jgi:hypothetical protein
MALGAVLAGCGGNGLFGRIGAGPNAEVSGTEAMDRIESRTRASIGSAEQGSTIWDVFRADQVDQTVPVNKYLWTASLDVLSFLPIQSVDPFTGLIVTGYGTPPGGGRDYRATVHITDPALEARSLRVSLQSRGGPVAAGTARAVEDAILARARQLRIADNRF